MNNEEFYYSLKKYIGYNIDYDVYIIDNGTTYIIGSDKYKLHISLLIDNILLITTYNNGKLIMEPGIKTRFKSVNEFIENNNKHINNNVLQFILNIYDPLIKCASKL